MWRINEGSLRRFMANRDLLDYETPEIQDFIAGTRKACLSFLGLSDFMRSCSGSATRNLSACSCVLLPTAAQIVVEAPLFGFRVEVPYRPLYLAFRSVYQRSMRLNLIHEPVDVIAITAPPYRTASYA